MRIYLKEQKKVVECIKVIASNKNVYTPNLVNLLFYASDNKIIKQDLLDTKRANAILDQLTIKGYCQI